MCAVHAVPADGVAAASQVESILAHGASSVLIVDYLLGIFHDILDGVLTVNGAVGNAGEGTISAR